MISNVVIRELELSDINETSGLIKCLEALSPGPYSIKDLIAAEKDRHFSGCCWTFVATGPASGNIYGCVGLTRERKLIHNGGIVLRLEDLCVNPRVQGNGIGKALVKHVIQYASYLKGYKLILNCKPELRGFYEILGFSSSGEAMRINF